MWNKLPWISYIYQKNSFNRKLKQYYLQGPTKHRKEHKETRDHNGPFRHKS